MLSLLSACKIKHSYSIITLLGGFYSPEKCFLKQKSFVFITVEELVHITYFKEGINSNVVRTAE